MNADARAITVVSGLPRSGTSLLMQMLEAGGVPILADQVRKADVDNPRGYYEFDPVKGTRTDSAWISEAPGRAVKVIAPLLEFLPPKFNYRVILMRRNLREIVRSQRAMLQRTGKKGAVLSDDQLTQVYAAQSGKVERCLADQPNIRHLVVDFNDLLREPESAIDQISDFLGGGLEVDAMQRVIDPSLYRQRAS